MNDLIIWILIAIVLLIYIIYMNSKEEEEEEENKESDEMFIPPKGSKVYNLIHKPGKIIK